MLFFNIGKAGLQCPVAFRSRFCFYSGSRSAQQDLQGRGSGWRQAHKPRRPHSPLGNGVLALGRRLLRREILRFTRHRKWLRGGACERNGVSRFPGVGVASVNSADSNLKVDSCSDSSHFWTFWGLIQHGQEISPRRKEDFLPVPLSFLQPCPSGTWR